MSIKPIPLASDYMNGMHPAILEAFRATNDDSALGYGDDTYCLAAADRIRAACAAPDAAVRFLIGGTQANAVVLDALLRSYESVISANTGHIHVHESGAIEFGGHQR